MYPLGFESITELLSGRTPSVAVGTLPLEVRRYFGRSHDIVYLSSESAAHILEQHGDHIEAQDLLRIPKILETGLWISEKQRPEWCSVFHYSSQSQDRFVAAVKVTKDRRECFLTTLHRAKKRQIRSKMRRGDVLRSHW